MNLVQENQVDINEQIGLWFQSINNLNLSSAHQRQSPGALAVGLGDLEILKTENLVEGSRKLGRYFLDGLKTLEHHPSMGGGCGTGFWLIIDFTVKKISRAQFPFENLTS